MARPVRTAVLAAALVAFAGCGDKAATELGAQEPAASQPGAPPAPAAPAPDDPAAPDEKATPPGRPSPPADPGRERLLELLVPKGVPTEAAGQRADPDDLAVVERWLAALTQGDIPAAAETFADGTVVQNLRPPVRLADRADRIAFNEQFPCGAEIVDASSVQGYLVVTYRLTDRVDSPCDGPGGTAAGTIKVEGGKMTEWYRLPDPAGSEADEPAGPAV